MKYNKIALANARAILLDKGLVPVQATYLLF